MHRNIKHVETQQEINYFLYYIFLNFSIEMYFVQLILTEYPSTKSLFSIAATWFYVYSPRKIPPGSFHPGIFPHGMFTRRCSGL